jgi:hypothetical protein
MISAVLFIVVAVIACLAALLAIIGIVHLGMSGPAAIERDGLPRGQRAPAWTLTSAAGARHTSPAPGRLQLLLFADHSLKSFPSVVTAVAELRAADRDLDIVVVLRQRSAQAEAVLSLIGLDGIPVVAGSPGLYADYNVRVGPFAIFVDPAGRVRGSSLVNDGWQIAKLRQVAGLPLEPDSAPARRPRRLARVGQP